MNNSKAKGCFVVLLSEDGHPDVFRALLRPNNSSTNLSSTISNIPPSTYTVLVYDLEQNLLPGHNPARELANIVNVAGTVLFVVLSPPPYYLCMHVLNSYKHTVKSYGHAVKCYLSV